MVVKLSRERSVGRSVCRSVCLSSALWKTADRIRMPFGILGRTGSGMRQVVGFGDRSTGRGTFGGEFGARHCNQWGLYRVGVRQRRDAALFRNYFGQTCWNAVELWLTVCLTTLNQSFDHSDSKFRQHGPHKNTTDRQIVKNVDSKQNMTYRQTKIEITSDNTALKSLNQSLNQSNNRSAS